MDTQENQGIDFNVAFEAALADRSLFDPKAQRERRLYPAGNGPSGATAFASKKVATFKEAVAAMTPEQREKFADELHAYAFERSEYSGEPSEEEYDSLLGDIYGEEAEAE